MRLLFVRFISPRVARRKYNVTRLCNLTKKTERVFLAKAKTYEHTNSSIFVKTLSTRLEKSEN